MAEKPVIVPVELQITDLDMNNADLENMSKDITKRLSGVTKSISDLFGKIDTSKINKAISTSMSKVESSVQKAIQAQESFKQAIIASGESSDIYADKLKELEKAQRELAVLKNDKSAWEDSSGKYIGGDPDKYIQAYERYFVQLQKVRALEEEVRPENFALTGSKKAIAKVEAAYKNVCEAIRQVNVAQQDFNKVAEANNVTDAYKEKLALAESLKNKLEQLNEKSKRMAEIGATDKAWEGLQYDTKQVSSELDSILRSLRAMIKEGSALSNATDEDVKRLQAELKSLNATRMNIAGNGKNRTGTIDARANAALGEYTKDYKEQLAALVKLEAAAQRMVEKYERMKALGKDTPAALQAAEYDAQALSARLEDVKRTLTDMVNEGKAFRLGQGDAASEISGINSRIEQTQSELDNITASGNKVTQAIRKFLQELLAAHPALAKVFEVATKVAPVLAKIGSIGVKIGQVLAKGLVAAAKGAAKLASALAKVAQHLLHIAGNILKAISRLNIFHKAGMSASKDMGKGFKKLQKNILMFGFGFRSAYYAIKRLRTTFFNAFKTLATQAEEINVQLSGLVMTLNRLKGSLATAFQPLATVVIPILNSVMDALSDTMVVLGKFFATLTGQGYIYKAIANQIDYADSLKKTGKAAGKTEEKLAAYDKLDVIKDDTGKGSNSLLDVTYQKADIEGAASDFAKLLKECWEKQDFTEAGEVVKEKLVSVLDNVNVSVIPKIVEFANKLTTAISTFFNGFDATDLGAKVAEGINNILHSFDLKQFGAAMAKLKSLFWQFADGLVNDIDWAGVGKSIGERLMGFVENFDIEAFFNTIVGLFNGLGEALINMAATVNWEEVGIKFGEAFSNALENLDIEKVFTGIASLLNGLALALAKFLEKTDFGDVALKLIEGLDALFGNLDGKSFKRGLTALIRGVVEFAAKLITGIDWSAIYDALKKGVEGLLTTLEDALNESGVPGLQMIGELVGMIHQVLETIWPVIEQIMQALWPLVESILPLINEFLPPILELISQAANMILPLITALVDSFINTVLPIIKDLIGAILPALGQVLDALQPAFDVLIQNVLPFIEKLLTAIMPLVKGILDLAVAILVPIVDLLAPLIELVVTILTPLLDLLTPILDLVGYLFSAVSQILSPILRLLTPLINLLTAILQPIFSVLGFIFELLTPLVDIIKFAAGVISGIVTPILNALVTAINIVVGVIKVLGQVFSSVFAGIRSAVSNAWVFIKGILNAIIAGIEAMSNAVINGLNVLIRGLNSIGFEVPDWVPSLGGKKFYLNVKELNTVSIPRLAQGAVIPPNREFLAMLGDQSSGTNIEAPLDTIKQALAEVIAEMGSANHDPIVLQLDGKTVAKVVWAEEEKKYKQTGRTSAYAY